VTDWQVIWLGVIAVAVAIIAAAQIGVMVAALRLARQLAATTDALRREMGPLIDKAHRIADDAARAASLAAVQVERLDRMLTTTASRVDEAVGIMRHAMGGPLRQGYAAMMALRAVVSALRRPRRREGAAREEDDALFVG
jgi:hypothetical protein